MNSAITAGSRVVVFDPTLFVDDVKTPLSMTMKPATVLRRYIYRSVLHPYSQDDVVDVRFDHDGRESRAHFTDGVTLIEPEVSA